MNSVSKIIAVIFAAAFILLVFGILANADKPKPSDNSSLEIPEQTEIVIVPSSYPERFSMRIPAGFQETSSEFYESYFFCDDASIIVTSEDILDGKRLDQYVNDMRIAYQTTVTDFKLLSDDVSQINRVTAESLEFTYTLNAADVSDEMHCFTTVLEKDSKIYIVTCKSLESTYQNYDASFRSAAKTIQIADADETKPAA